MRKRTALAALAACTALVAASRAQPLAQLPASPPREIKEALAAGHGAYLAGRIEEAASDYRYVLTLQPDNDEAVVSLALAYKDLGRLDEALPLWIKATLLNPDDSFAWLQRGWTLLGLREFKDARKAFEKAAEYVTPPAYSDEAELGLGLIETEDGSPRKAVEHLQRVVLGNAYWLPEAYHLLGRAASGQKNWAEAAQFEQEAFKEDPALSEAAWGLARLEEKIGDPVRTYQVYRALLTWDPANPALREKVAKLSRYVKKQLGALTGVRRIAFPLTKPEPRPGSEELKVALVADPLGRPSVVQSLAWIASADFQVIDERLGPVAAGKALQKWEAVYIPGRRIYELRGTLGRLEYATKLPFRLEPLAQGGTILLKQIRLAGRPSPEALPDEARSSPEAAAAPPGVDIGDRELRGKVEFKPAEGGFTLVNDVEVEDYLPSIAARTMPETLLKEAVKAAAVLYRSLALDLSRRSRHPGEAYQLCDSVHCLLYEGVQRETPDAREAVQATRGERLKLPGEGTFAIHPACGGRTEAGVQDSALEPWAVRSPRELEERVRAAPPRDLACQLSTYVPPVGARWLRVLDVDDLSPGLPALENLRGFTPGRRSASGRLLSGTFRGPVSSATVDADGLEAALSPTSLRSTLFTVTPLYRGRRLKRLILWGAGTGDGRGLCRGGALGLASLGQGYRDILKHYYPDAALEGLIVPEAPKPESPPAPASKKKAKSRPRPKPASKVPASAPPRTGVTAPAAP